MRIYHLAIFLVLCVVGYVVYQHYNTGAIAENGGTAAKDTGPTLKPATMATNLKAKLTTPVAPVDAAGKVVSTNPVLWPIVGPFWGVSKIF